jgi:hypothetical protein
VKHTPTIQLYYNGSWNDVTSDIYASSPISYGYDLGSESGETNPGYMTISFDNSTGKYNPRYPMSSLYSSTISGMSIPIRLMNGATLLWQGITQEWNIGRSVKGKSWCEVVSAGISRRLRQGETPLKCALTRAIIALLPIVYWPLDDGTLSTSGGCVVPGEPGFIGLGTSIEFSKVDGPYGAPSKMPELAADIATGEPVLSVVPASSTGNSWTIDMLVYAKKVGVFSFFMPFLADSTDGTLIVQAVWTDGGTIQLIINITQKSGAAYVNLSPAIDIFDSLWHQIRIEVSQSGGTVTLEAFLDDVSLGNDSDSFTPGAITSVSILSNPLSTLASGSIGHIAVYSGVSTSSTFAAVGGYNGESAYTRSIRLCAEEGVAFSAYTDTASHRTQKMGPQGVDTFLNLLKKCSYADCGILYDKIGELHFKTSRYIGLYRTPITFSYSDLVPTPQIKNDDRDFRNDVTVKRTNGSLARAVLSAGPMSTSDIGVYSTSLEKNLSDDSVLIHHANHHLHVGTIEDPRFQSVTIDLDANPSIIAAAESITIGKWIKIEDIPIEDSPDDITMIVTSVSGTIGTHRRTITIQGIPGASMRMATYGGSDSRYASSGSTLASDVTSTSTSLSVVPGAVRWVTAADSSTSIPFDVVVGGERMTVTAVVGTSSPQTFTVARSANGIVKAHSAGAGVQIYNPEYYALWEM